jgi:ferredoxin
VIRATVDADLCTGHGRCYALAPGLYAPDDEGYNAARGRVLEFADEHEALVRRGAKGCPERAITIIDD